MERCRMDSCRSFSHVKPQILGFGVFLGCMIATSITVGLLKSPSQLFPDFSLQLSSIQTTSTPVSSAETRVSEQQSNQITSLQDMQLNNSSNRQEDRIMPSPLQATEVNNTHEGTETTTPSLDTTNKEAEKQSVEGNKMTISPTEIGEHKDQYNTIQGNQTLDSNIICDFSKPRSDTCTVHGDVRIVGSSTSVILAQPFQFNTSNTRWKIKPYARKWELSTMEGIKEISIRVLTESQDISVCTVNHTIPSIIFSTGGYVGNYFHDLTDVIIPLFVTSRHYKGDVRFLVTNFKPQWIDKYQLILKQLSQHEIINLDTDNRVHCFSEVHVGLKSHKVMGIDPSETPNGYSMIDFKDFLRDTFLLKRKDIERIGDEPRKKPRLLIMSRKGSRSLTNEKSVIKMARGLGYNVVITGPKEAQNLTQIANIVNSCDVMMGLHGAGLTNMIFLPENAILIQIIPWGGLTWACRHDFGEPAPDMGIKYLEYEIKEKESSLIKQYPRNHPVFKDPLSIHKQGFGAIWAVFLDKQNVKLDVGRFKSSLLEALQSLKQ